MACLPARGRDRGSIRHRFSFKKRHSSSFPTKPHRPMMPRLRLRRSQKARPRPLIGVAGGSTSQESAANSPITPINIRRSSAILRDVSLKIEENGGGPENLKFEGSARGDVFDKILLKGTVNLTTGAITLEGELAGLTLSETLRRRLPRETLPTVNALALNSGVVDIELKRFRYRWSARNSAANLSYQAIARLREGVWECAKLPFPVNDLSAWISAEDGILSIKHAQGSNGPTTLRVEGTMAIGELKVSPLDLRVDLLDLELDQRLRSDSGRIRRVVGRVQTTRPCERVCARAIATEQARRST